MEPFPFIVRNGILFDHPERYRSFSTGMIMEQDYKICHVYFNFTYIGIVIESS